MNSYSLLAEYGYEVEQNAKIILEKEFDKIIWVSKKKPTSPFDFLCVKNNKEIKVDVKGCLSKSIYISKNKIERLKKGEFGDFYYMLRIDTSTFHLIHYKDLFKNKNYKIITNKKEYKIRFQSLKTISEWKKLIM